MRTSIKKNNMSLFSNNHLKLGTISYSQCGEDLIIINLCKMLGIKHPVYLDIGCNHPIRFSNTYKLYLEGSRGICVEPNPELKDIFKKRRPLDVFLPIGIGITSEKSEEDYYLMDWHEFNSFSKEQAEKVQEYYKGKNNIKKQVKVQVVDINQILEERGLQELDLLSLDVEGWDFEIIKRIDYVRFTPKIICVEGIDVGKVQQKRLQLKEFIMSKGYTLIADTSINYIFLDNTSFGEL